ncbi:helix-turn-helix domain-containing protein [Streptomyces sp. NPDC058953]|uniref:helix-turn-helix domain-containing protein n=1 Tax=unclassified Streptomyces TaxID=2593676 RepID=UPI003684A3A9
MPSAESFGELLRRLRIDTGRSQEEQAEAVNTASGRDTLTRREVSRYENNENIPTRQTTVHIAVSCGVPPETLLKAAARARDQRRRGSSRETDTRSGSPDDDMAVVDRAVTVSLEFADLMTPANTDEDQLGYLRDSLARIAIRYVHTPVLPLFNDLVGIRDEVFGLLRRRQKPGHAADLYVLAGTACLLMAHASQNLGHSSAALGQIRTANACAQQIDHRPLRAWTAATAALIAEWSGQPARALQLTERAAALAPAGHSRIRATAIEARTAARAGDLGRATGALAQMHDAQGESADPDGITEFGGIFTFPSAKQDYYRGATYSLLGRHDEAEFYATRAVEQYRYGPPESRSYGDEALATIDIALARIRQDDIPTAARVLQELLELAPAKRIRQIALGLHTITGALTQPPARERPEAIHLIELTRAYQVLGDGALPSVR